MMRLVVFSTLLSIPSMLSAIESVIAQPIQEYQRRFIGDIGFATVGRSGAPVVVMNPAACRRLGPELCSFFRAHEWAHHQLGHFNRNISVQQKEAEADRYAASRVSPAARAAAASFFASGRGASRQHGTSQQRYQRVAGSGYQGPQSYAVSTNRIGPPNARLGATHYTRRARGRFGRFLFLRQ